MSQIKIARLGRVVAFGLVVAVVLPIAAEAQNVAIVNGKAIPKARVEALIDQAVKSGQQKRSPELEKMARDEVVTREIFIQEATRRGITTTEEFKTKLEFSRQQLVIGELFAEFQKSNPVTDADAKAEYDKYKAAQGGGAEYRARHILVEKEDEAVAIIAELKGGANFEELAKTKSKDPGSAVNGGDLDFAAPSSYVPEFGQAMVKLKKGEFTEVPVKTQFGYHIIRLDDTRESSFPPFEEVKAQIVQRLQQQKIAEYRDELRAKAKTDYKFEK